MNLNDENEMPPQENIDENNLDALNDEASNYLTDSDIDDPKYQPNALHHSSSLRNQAQSIPPNINRQIQDMQKLNDKIRHMKTFQEANDKNIRDLQSENNVLKTEIIKLKETLSAKEALINEFQFYVEKSNDKFKQFEEKNELLLQEKQDLINKLSEYESEIKVNKNLNEELSSHERNIVMLKEHISEMENQLIQKESLLTKKFSEREDEIKNELLNEINKLTKQNEDLRTENEKYKYDISMMKINVDNLNSLIDDKDSDYQSTLNKKEKEIKRLTEEINDNKSKYKNIEDLMHKKDSIADNEIAKLQEAKESLLEELTQKRDKEYDLESQVKDLMHLQESLTLENQENKITLSNKDVIIEQLKSQIDELHKDITNKENEIELIEQDKQKTYQEYNNHLNATIKEKNEIENENNSLRQDLISANETIKGLHDFIRDKHTTMQQTLYKETMKNDNLQKKYKSVIKQLKIKEKNLYDENKSLKSLLNEKDLEKEQIEYRYQNELKNMSLYNNVNNNNNNTSIMMNQSQQQLQYNHNQFNNMNNTSTNVFTNTNYAVNNSVHVMNYNNNINNTYKFDETKDDEQKRTLEEFKRLLNKMDEKLDLPFNNNNNNQN
jgi:chromosome segregation ATPase